MIVTDSVGCSDTSNVYQYIALSNSDLSLHAYLVYPNPSSGIIHIDLMSRENKIQFTVYDLQSEIILSDHIQNTTGFDMDISSFANGNYLLRIEADGWKESIPVTKK